MSRGGARRRPEPTPAQRALALGMRTQALSGWYTGDMETLRAFGAFRTVRSVYDRDLAIRLIFTRDRMHHSVGWWRNADYECCWHLSLSACPRAKLRNGLPDDFVDVPVEDERVWGHALFGDYVRWVWHEPGGTDPRYSPDERLRYKHLLHLRLFVDHELPHVPIFPKGEVYHLTRWVPGLTPAKVDR